MSKIKHKFGEFESMKFDYRRKNFNKYIKYIEEKKIDLILTNLSDSINLLLNPKP